MHSTAQASGMAFTRFPPQASAAARHKAGRIRLPPAKSEYRIARWIVPGLAVTGGRKRSSALLTARVDEFRKPCRSNGCLRSAPDILVVAAMRPCFRESRIHAQADSEFLYCIQIRTGY